MFATGSQNIPSNIYKGSCSFRKQNHEYVNMCFAKYQRKKN